MPEREKFVIDLSFSAQEEAFRQEVRAFLRRELPTELRRKVARGDHVAKAEHIAWLKVLERQGWIAPLWPKAWGGAGWTSVQRVIFDEECALECAPRANVPSLDLFGPVVIEFGSEAQKQRILPGIRASRDWWCQGFSEPGAGSDLAALKTRAVRDGDEFVVNGSKIWTSHAHFCNWMFALVRTSTEARKQAGISMLAIPMDAPGVSVSPIITVGGLHHVNQVFLEDVRVPADNLIGRPGDAWRMTGFLLSHERVVGAGIGASLKLLRDLKSLARRPDLIADLAFEDRVALLETEVIAHQYTAYRVLAAEMAGEPPGPEVSVLKIRGAEIQQGLCEAIAEAVGQVALIQPATVLGQSGDWAEDPWLHAATTYFDRRKISIYGGSSEIQKNIISRRILKI